MFLRSRLLLVLFACSGFAALSWETLWQVYGCLAVGVSAESVAITISVMMAGITLGAALGGSLLNRWRQLRPLMVLAVAEGLVGVLGILMPWGFEAVGGFDALVYRHVPALAPATQVVSIALLLGPAAIAMGVTVPLMQPLAAGFGSRVVTLYAANTLGAALGIFAQTFWLVPALGLRGAGAVAAMLNLSVAFIAVRAARSDMGPAPETAQVSRPALNVPVAQGRLFAFASGFVTFALEVAWFRSLKAAFQSTTDSFALMLGGFLVPIAVGTFIARKTNSSQNVIAWTAFTGGVLAMATNPMIDRVDLLNLSTHGYWFLMAERMAIVLLLIGAPVVFISIALPTLFTAARDAADLGQLYAVNALGCVMGSIVSAWVLLPRFGAYATALFCGVAFALLGAGHLPRFRRLGTTMLAILIAAVGLRLGSGVGRIRVQAAGLSRELKPLATLEGADATVSVAVDAAGDKQLIIDGFQTAGEASEGHYMAWMGHLPMLLQRQPQRALVICFGTGQTANAVRREGPDALDIVELSPEVIAFAHYFTSNDGVLKDPRVHLVRGDGRAWLRRSKDKYDVITLEPMEPHFAGTNDLYSVEFYRAAAHHLDDEGVVAQWLPLHLLLPWEAASVVRTFAEVFPNSALWIDPKDRTGILVGRRESSPLIDTVRRPDMASGHRDLDAIAVTAAFVLRGRKLRAYGESGEIISDDNQLLAYGTERRRIYRIGSTARNHELNLEIIKQFGSRMD